MKTSISMFTKSRLLRWFGYLATLSLLGIGALDAQTVSYIIPDIGTPGMNTSSK